MLDVLVTGSAGLVENHVLRGLGARGLLVRGVDVEPLDPQTDRLDVGDVAAFSAYLM